MASEASGPLGGTRPALESPLLERVSPGWHTKAAPVLSAFALATASEFLLALDLIGCARLIGVAEKLLDHRIQFGLPNGF